MFARTDATHIATQVRQQATVATSYLALTRLQLEGKSLQQESEE